jgi:FkbM family methyltransferase
MTKSQHGIGFILASTDHGAMIVNRFDFKVAPSGTAFGVGIQLLDKSSYQPDEIDLAIQLLDLRRKHFGDGVKALDIGANIGVFTIAWAKHMSGWGDVLAIEAQERIYYALAGNIALANRYNASAIHAVATTACGPVRMPVPNYLRPGSFGSLELRPSAEAEDIGQPIDYGEGATVSVNGLSIDSLNLRRLDLMKIDVERMEMEVLEGARQTIAAHRPILIVEKLKTDTTLLRGFLDSYGYKYFAVGMNLVGIHASDPCTEIGRDPPRPAAAGAIDRGT